MHDNITTIPISELLEAKDGCPICRLRDEVERRTVEFILGGAVMEPEVRKVTNKQGFCHLHFQQMLGQKNKLAVALLLDSHLAECDGLLAPGGFLKKNAARSLPLVREQTEDCFVCRRVQWGMEHLLDTLVRLWQKEPEIKAAWESQPTLCLPHYVSLCRTAEASLAKKDAAAFAAEAAALSRKGLTELRSDVAWFCQKHDYRHKDADWGASRDSVERAVAYLTARKP